ncbi:MAG: response regulator transcription factor [Chloroflexota bacterium]|nr:response regulator transcription factor [Chloroflexota bacterium]
MPIRVVIADDHAIVREGIRLLLEGEADMKVVGEAEDGAEAFSVATKLQPDVVLIDVAMPGVNGLEASRRIKGSYPRMRLLMLTQDDEDEGALRLWEAGASGSVPKTSGAAALIDAIRAVHAGKTGFQRSERGANWSPGSNGGHARGSRGSLSQRQLQVLKLIADGHSNKRIAGLLCLSVKTIQAHRGQLMKKLELHDRTEIVKYAVIKGIICIEPEVGRHVFPAG